MEDQPPAPEWMMTDQEFLIACGIEPFEEWELKYECDKWKWMKERDDLQQDGTGAY